MRRPQPSAAHAPVRVHISEQADVAVKDFAAVAAPFETGGVLAGVATPDGVWITTVIEVSVPDRRRAAYQVPAGVTPAIIDQVRLMDERLGYIGDWHSHPADASASDVDLRTLSKLTSSRANARRVILVAKTNGSTWTVEAWARDGRRSVSIDLELTGDLPEAPLEPPEPLVALD